MVTVEPQLSTVSTDCSVEMMGTKEGEDGCSAMQPVHVVLSGSDCVPPGETGRQLCVSPIDLGNQTFVGLTSQLQEFLDGMNENMRC